MCTFSRPVDLPSNTAAKGRMEKQGEQREVVVIPHFGALGVDLPPVKKIQRREGTRWVLLD